MVEGKILDIAHISFLDMIKVLIAQSGAANAKGVLIRNALNAANMIDEVEFDSLEEFIASIEGASNPIAQIEGRATHLGDSLFGLKFCPFAPSIANYREVFGSLPDGYSDITREFNKPSMVTTRYRIGEGAGVSPFCAVHQSLRSALGDKVKIGRKKVDIYQLGCRSGSGEKGIASRWLNEAGISRHTVEKALDDYMCCYFIGVDGKR